jgi:hypothetical protein
LRFWARCLLVALISGGMLNFEIQPLAAAEAKPFGIVVRADHARVSEANASNGATVYPGDSIDTDTGGELRLAIGKGQLYLLSYSAANLGAKDGVPRAAVLRGTVGFSSLTAQQFELDTPEGVVHAANGLPAFGQVTITGPKELRVSAYSGTLLLERNDQKLSIQPGQSYDVALVAGPEPSQQPSGVKPAYQDHLVWKIAVIVAAGLTGYFLWRHFNNSNTDPK